MFAEFYCSYSLFLSTISVIIVDKNRVIFSRKISSLKNIYAKSAHYTSFLLDKNAIHAL